MAVLVRASGAAHSCASPPAAGSVDKNSLSAALCASRVALSPVRLTIAPLRPSRQRRISARSAAMASHSPSMRPSNARMNSRYSMPLVASEARPATLSIAPSSDAATLWPPPTTAASPLDLVSSTICRNRSLSSSLDVSSMSDMMAYMSFDWSFVALPRNIRWATGSSEPGLLMITGYAEMPPVLEPMRSLSSTKLSLSVPISCRQRQKSGTSGRSRVGTVRRSSNTSV
mmetsp:Transcript_14849/g.46251  ORF Transcript_14849/g.46251 Transcript_14849/m.46251 type:complete len:229 (-) Transcript_14849:1868-2554(-)